jgi:hypothetical protein
MQIFSMMYHNHQNFINNASIALIVSLIVFPPMGGIVVELQRLIVFHIRTEGC